MRYDRLIVVALALALAGCHSSHRGGQKMMIESAAPDILQTRIVLVDPVYCQGVAGNFGGLGAGLKMTIVSDSKYNSVVGMVTKNEEVESGEPIEGVLLFMSHDVLEKARQFVPKGFP